MQQSSFSFVRRIQYFGTKLFESRDGKCSDLNKFEGRDGHVGAVPVNYSNLSQAKTGKRKKEIISTITFFRFAFFVALVVHKGRPQMFREEQEKQIAREATSLRL